MDDDNSTSSNQSDYKIYYVGNDQYNDGINYVHIGEGKDEKLLKVIFLNFIPCSARILEIQQRDKFIRNPFYKYNIYFCFYVKWIIENYL